MQRKLININKHKLSQLLAKENFSKLSVTTLSVSSAGVSA